MNDIVITYLCDRKACTNCMAPECMHTMDIRHAVNFEARSIGTRDYFTEKIDAEYEFAKVLLTQEAVDFINRYPLIINELAEKHNELIKCSLEKTKEF